MYTQKYVTAWFAEMSVTEQIYYTDTVGNMFQICEI